MNGLGTARSTRRSAVLGVAGALLASMLVTSFTRAATVTVVMEHYFFNPTPLSISTGTTVTWVNKDPTEHQVVSDTGAFPKSKLLKTGEKYSYTFTKAGTYPYHDGFGTTMKGTVIVTGPPKATPKPAPRPTPRPTPKPTVTPTAEATPIPEATAAATAEPTAASPGPDATGSETPGGGPTAAPSGSDGAGSGDGSGSGGGFDVASIVIGLVLAVLLFLAWMGVQSMRRNRPGPPTGGSWSGGPSGSGGSGGSGSSGATGGSGDPGGPGDVATASGPAWPGDVAATDHAPTSPLAVESAPVALSPASRRLVRRPAQGEPFGEDPAAAPADPYPSPDLADDVEPDSDASRMSRQIQMPADIDEDAPIAAVRAARRRTAPTS